MVSGDLGRSWKFWFRVVMRLAPDYGKSGYSRFEILRLARNARLGKPRDQGLLLEVWLTSGPGEQIRACETRFKGIGGGWNQTYKHLQACKFKIERFTSVKPHLKVLS